MAEPLEKGGGRKRSRRREKGRNEKIETLHKYIKGIHSFTNLPSNRNEGYPVSLIKRFQDIGKDVMEVIYVHIIIGRRGRGWFN